MCIPERGYAEAVLGMGLGAPFAAAEQSHTPRQALVLCGMHQSQLGRRASQIR